MKRNSIQQNVPNEVPNQAPARTANADTNASSVIRPKTSATATARSDTDPATSKPPEQVRKRAGQMQQSEPVRNKLMKTDNQPTTAVCEPTETDEVFAVQSHSRASSDPETRPTADNEHYEGTVELEQIRKLHEGQKKKQDNELNKAKQLTAGTIEILQNEQRRNRQLHDLLKKSDGELKEARQSLKTIKDCLEQEQKKNKQLKDELDVRDMELNKANQSVKRMKERLENELSKNNQLSGEVKVKEQDISNLRQSVQLSENEVKILQTEIEVHDQKKRTLEKLKSILTFQLKEQINTLDEISAVLS